MTKEIRFTLNILSTALKVFGVMLMPSVLLSLRYSAYPCATTMFILGICTATSGLIISRLIHNDGTQVSSRVYFSTMLVTWFTLILLSAIPFYLSGQGYRFVDTLFEATAAWTTTGASVIKMYDLPVGLLLWRSTLNWMGGIGMLILTLTILRTWQFVGRPLMKLEVPGPGFIKSETTFRKGFRLVLLIYCLLTLMQYAALRLAGMPRLSALLTSMSNLSTSGLQHMHPEVVIGLSTPIKAIITLFAFFGSINTSTFILLMMRKWYILRNASELKFRVCEILLTTLMITIALLWTGRGLPVLQTLGNSLMQVVSFTSTAGYRISDSSAWPYVCKMLLFLEVFIGASAVSTGGGIKSARAILAIKTISYSLYRHIHPRSIRSITYAGKPIKPIVVLRANLYITLFFIVFIFGALFLSLDTNVPSALGLSQAMITNTGTSVFGISGLHEGTLTGFSDGGKLLMTLLMLLGRLEIFPILVLFSRSFWRKDQKTGE